MIEATGSGLRLRLAVFDEQRKTLATGSATDLYEGQGDLPFGGLLHQALCFIELDAMALGIAFCAAWTARIELPALNDPIAHLGGHRLNGFELHMIPHAGEPRHRHQLLQPFLAAMQPQPIARRTGAHAELVIREADADIVRFQVKQRPMQLAVERAHQHRFREIRIGAQANVDVVVHDLPRVAEDTAANQRRHHEVLVFGGGSLILE